MKAFAAMLLALGIMVLASCAPAPTPEPTPSPLPSPTPTALELFESLVLPSKLTFAPSKPEYELHCQKITVTEMSYNVKATTSLVSPFLGDIAYSIQEPTRQYQITEDYAFQKGVWVLKDTHADDSYQYDNSLLGIGYCSMLKP